MKFSESLFTLFLKNLEGKEKPAPKPIKEEDLDARSSLKMFFIIEQTQRIMPFTCDEIYIREPQKGELSFGIRHEGTVHAKLAYTDNRWYITAANREQDVWLSGIRLKHGQQYLVRSGDQIVLKEKVSIIVQCHPGGRPSPHRIEQLLENLEGDVARYAKSKETDRAAFDRILKAMLRAPVYCWGGFRPDPVTGQIGSFIQAVPKNRGPNWRPTTEGFEELNRGTAEPLCIPVFTSREYAEKGNCPLGAFPYDFPLPVFNQIVKMNMDVVINPFSEFSVTIPQRYVTELWAGIREMNNMENCPVPDWRMHSRLERLEDHMYDWEDDDDDV